MLQVILTIIGLLIVLAGVILIYDGRIITRKFFGFGDQNEGTLGLKLIGFMLALLGALLIFVANRF